MASSSIIGKQSTCKITKIDLNQPIKKIQDFDNINLEIFEKNPIWSDEYRSQLNIQRCPFDFQIGLVQSIIESGNSIVSLRTGAGKTYIAALIIKYYYIKKRKQTNDHFLTFFFIPNRSIRDQQVQAIRDVGDLYVMPCDDDSTANEFIYLNNVVVCTSQKFLNCLFDKTILLNQIDLIIFDECHHCIGNHPYSKVMEQILVYHQSEHRPKIIGLTASCGTKLTNAQLTLQELPDLEIKRQNALRKLYELCATLNCYNVVSVTKAEHVEELSRKIPKPTDDEILTVQSSSFDEYIKDLRKELTCILSYIGSQCNPTIPPLTDEQKLVEEKHRAEKDNNFNNVILITYMIILVKRFEALADLPLKSVMCNIIKKIDLFYNKKEDPIELETEIHHYSLLIINDLVEKMWHNGYYLTNPKLDFLTDLLRKLVQQKENARGLVLVSRTLYAKLLFDYFQERSDVQNIIKPGWLVGQNGVDFQNSLSEQDEALNDFRKGLSNVLIATDIIQEGLDVPECSFVIRYEFVSNEIGTVQSRGRARAEKSSCFLVVDTNSNNHMKEIENRSKEMEMLEALNNWKQTSTEERHQNIQNLQNGIIEQWHSEAQLQRAREASLQDPRTIDGRISCRSCNYYLGEVSWLRKRNNTYFVRPEQFAERIEIERYLVAEIYREIRVNGKVCCGNTACRQELGGVQEYNNRPDIREICALKCKQLKFSFNGDNGKIKFSIFAQWTGVDFKILELEPFIPDNDTFNQE